MSVELAYPWARAAAATAWALLNLLTRVWEGRSIVKLLYRYSIVSAGHLFVFLADCLHVYADIPVAHR